MQAAIFVMAIMGCGESDGPCQQLRLLETRYESQAQCAAATEEAVMRFGDADYPVIVAQCQAANAPKIVRGSDVRLPNPERTPLFSGR
ncbi:MAG TPA: hypothetical protein VGD10_04925 [Allosphingosinicella sp.]|uniref:hypothetical protein n=1 Tax=Allosphingosinicella sp. TaxID=2823234 RepID=UPI002ED8546F